MCMLIFTAHFVFVKAGLRHVRGVRPNRAADFRGAPFWTLKLCIN